MLCYVYFIKLKNSLSPIVSPKKEQLNLGSVHSLASFIKAPGSFHLSIATGLGTRVLTVGEKRYKYRMGEVRKKSILFYLNWLISINALYYRLFQSNTTVGRRAQYNEFVCIQYLASEITKS